MGQKTNPNILRLGITKHWKTEFFEKKKKELPLYIFKDLEIQSYIERFLESKGVLVYDYNQFFSNNTLNLYISCFISSKFRKSQKLVLIDSKGEKFVQNFVNRHALKKYKARKNVNKISFENTMNKSLSFVKEMYCIKKYLSLISFHSRIAKFPYTIFENCLVKMSQVILKFTVQQFDIILNFSCLNKDFSYLKFLKKKNVNLFQRFKNVDFFKQDGLEVLFYVVFNKNSAKLLAKFISFQLKTTKRPIFLLSCIRKTLKLLMALKQTTLIKGIKIMFKGRLRKGPRAKHKTVLLGDVPVQTLDSNIDYFQTTTHNAKGSYGIKVWIVCK